MYKNALRKLAKKYVEGTASNEEVHFLNAYYQRFAELGQAHPGYNSLNLRRVVVSAAAILVFGVLGIYLHFSFSARTEGYLTFNNPHGKISRITLADGTSVLLNSLSSLTYPVTFRGQNRTVSLKGEAYFEVSHDRKHPFQVITGELTTHVLGTHFNIKAFAGKKIDVTLLQGRVMLTTAHKRAAINSSASGPDVISDTIFLAPNEKASFESADFAVAKGGRLSSTAGLNSLTSLKRTAMQPSTFGALSKQVLSNSGSVTSWKDGILVFKNEPLEDALDAISRKFGVHVSASPALQGLLVSATLQNESLEGTILTITRQIQLENQHTNTASNPVVKRDLRDAQFKKIGNNYYIE